MSAFLGVRDVCKLLGKTPTRRNCELVRIDVMRRIKAAKGKLDSYKPQRRRKEAFKFTTVSLKYIYPEFFDRKDAIEKELARRFKEMELEIRGLRIRIEQAERASREGDELLARAIRELRAGKRSQPAA